MDFFGLFWLVVSCTWWFTVSVEGMGRKVLSDLHGTSPVLFEVGLWDLVIYIYGPSVPFYCHPGHLYGTIQEHRERKSARLLYGAGREEKEIEFLAASEKGQG